MTEFSGVPAYNPNEEKNNLTLVCVLVLPFPAQLHPPFTLFFSFSFSFFLVHGTQQRLNSIQTVRAPTIPYCSTPRRALIVFFLRTDPFLLHTAPAFFLPARQEKPRSVLY